MGNMIDCQKAEPPKEQITTFSAGAMPSVPFQCEAAVWCDNDSGSLCYTTSMERAKWIAEKLNTVCQSKAEQPEPVRQNDGGEFTKELRCIAECFWKSSLKMARFRKKVREACDRLDALEAENKAQAERIKMVRVKNGFSWAENKAQAKEIENLKKENKRLSRIIELDGRIE